MAYNASRFSGRMAALCPVLCLGCWKMKILTLLGTRPEIIRLSRIIEKLDATCDHFLVHTGQNFDPRLKDIIFQQLKIRDPDLYLDAKGGFGDQIGVVFSRVEE